jgi:hypothetical protein
MTMNTSDPEFRENFSRLAAERENQIRKFMRKSKIDLISIPASGDWEKPLLGFFRERARRAA